MSCRLCVPHDNAHMQQHDVVPVVRVGLGNHLNSHGTFRPVFSLQVMSEMFRCLTRFAYKTFDLP
jgi:hypothetical protein